VGDARRLARETSTIRLGTLVTAGTFRLPGVLGDQRRAGRPDERRARRARPRHRVVRAGARGVRHPVPALGERFDRFEEQLQVVTGLWDADGPFSFAGEHYTRGRQPALPKPVQRPHPPVIVGGGGAKRTPRLAATYADEFNLPFASLADTRTQFGRVREASAATGRDLVLSVAQVLCCGRDEAELARRAAAVGRSVEDLRANGVAGTPAEVVDRLGAFGELGATRAYLQVLDLGDLDHVELVASEVLPPAA
jgi:alkanesulfonate monooxygenase